MIIIKGESAEAKFNALQQKYFTPAEPEQTKLQVEQSIKKRERDQKILQQYQWLIDDGADWQEAKNILQITHSCSRSMINKSLRDAKRGWISG